MLVLHAHWQPPRSPQESGDVLFWAETSDAPQPAWQRGRAPIKSRMRQHPFCASSATLRTLLIGLLGEMHCPEGRAALWLPTLRNAPQASPVLVYGWGIDPKSLRQVKLSLAAWTVHGVRLAPREALLALATLPSLVEAQETSASPLALGADAHFWHLAASLAMETLAAQKILPVLAPADEDGRLYHARWLPVLDGPKDAVRLSQLQAGMPPLCRAEYDPERAAENRPISPRALLSTFLNTVCDAAARFYGRESTLMQINRRDEPVLVWLTTLFKDSPAVKVTPAQMQSFVTSHRAWVRNLEIAGDATYRITFRLEAPARQPQNPAARQWRLHYFLQARDDPSLLVPAEVVWQSSGSTLNRLGRRFDQPQERLLAGLGYAARLFSPITESLRSKRPSQLSLDTQRAYIFLREAGPLLEEAGFGLLAPSWWNQRGARLSVRLRLKPGSKAEEIIPGGKLSMNKLVNYQWELSLGGATLSREEFEALAALKIPLVQIRGQWVQLDSDQIEAAIRFWDKQQMEGEMGLLEALQYELGVQQTSLGLPVDEVTHEGWVAQWLDQFNQWNQGNSNVDHRLGNLSQPTGLRGELRPYQRFGLSWLEFYRRWQLGVCLADDMGLGKTIQALALLLHEKETQGGLAGPVLLICPTSVVTNWEREAQRFAPGITTMVHQGPNRLRGEDFEQAVQSVDLVLTSYVLARQDADTLQGINWLGVILDEAQNIKNASAKQTQAVRKLAAQFRLALTGTPVENRLSELWSIMNFLNPGYLGSRQEFRQAFALPIERYGDEEATNRLKKMVGPFILRRVKTDPRVIQDLPDKIEMKVYCNLVEEQATLYQAVVQEVLKKVETSEGMERRGQVLSMLMQLKQICNHPAQYLHQFERSSELTAAQQATLAGRSGKLERLVEMLDEMLAVGDKALIFTQFTEMGGMLASYLPSALGCAVQYLHGGVPPKARDTMVQRFQEDEHSPSLFILSLKAGGTGLNLTRANHVFHFDRWWNPAVEDQATDRAFRIGQARNVQVHKFITVGTLEEMIDDMIEGKKGLVRAVVGQGEEWLTELSTDDLRDLVQLRP